MTLKETIKEFADWYCPADGAVDRALAQWLSDTPDKVKPIDMARAARILNYSAKIGFDLGDYASNLYYQCCGMDIPEHKLTPNF